MTSEYIDAEARNVLQLLTSGPRLVAIGSTSFWHSESARTCHVLGGLLAAIRGLELVTGGVPGVGEAIGRAFCSHRKELGLPDAVVHVLPRGGSAWDYGRTLFAGSDMAERREVLGRLASTYVAIEGGPGTAHEASVAVAHGAIVIPIGRSGGFAAELFAKVQAPAMASIDDWRLLGAMQPGPQQAAEAAFRVISSCLDV